MTQDKALRELFDLFRSDPVLFVQRVIGVEPLEWQKQFLYAVRDNQRVACKSGTGVGKTSTLSWIILWALLFIHPVKVGVTSPSLGQLSRGLLAELETNHRKIGERFPALRDQLILTSDTMYRVDAPSDAFASFQVASADKPESLRGQHSPNQFFILDEASAVPDESYVAILGAMSTKGSRMIMASNPTRLKGAFYDAFHSNAELWKLFSVNYQDSTLVDPDYIRSIALAHGEDSAIYRVQCLGEFPYADDDVLIPRNWIDAAVRLWESNTIEPVDGPVVWGLDPARFGSDKTALAKRQGNRLIEPTKVWTGKDNMQVCGLIVEEINRTPTNQRPAEIVIDANGFGAGIADRLREQGYPVAAVNTGERPQVDTDRFVRLRDELWWRCREWFETRTCTMPDDPELVFQLSAPAYQFESNGKIKVEGKDQTRKRLGRKGSPDRADAFVLTLFNQSRYATSARYSGRQEVDVSWVV